jgi:hypothetical protein
MFWKCGTVQIFGNDYNKSKPDSGGPVEGSCEHGNEPPGFIKCWEILEYTIGSFLRRAELHE